MGDGACCSVPHTLSLATSIRNPSGTETPSQVGWSGDGAPSPGALRDFQTGAIAQHYTRTLSRVVGADFRLATSGELDRIDRFMRQLGRLNEITLSSVVMNDTGANAGRVKFMALPCNGCHFNAGANTSGGSNLNFNTGVEAVRVSSLAAFPRDGGSGVTANADGTFGDGKFNTPPLIEAADTGPCFHTATTVGGASAHNVAVATTIEEAIAFTTRRRSRAGRSPSKPRTSTTSAGSCASATQRSISRWPANGSRAPKPSWTSSLRGAHQRRAHASGCRGRPGCRARPRRGPRPQPDRPERAARLHRACYRF